MTKTIQIRNVPDELHRTLKARAASARMSLSSFLLAEIETIASRPTLEEMLKRLEALPHVDLPSSAAELIRQERDSR